jgi:hypothetical protein
LSQLSVQLPQNSGARWKGNWPSEVHRLQYLASCPISWRCDMISRRATKSKPNTRKVKARARNWEIRSIHSKGGAPAPVSPKPAQDSTSAPIPPSRGKLAFPRAGQQRHCSFCAEVGRSRPKRLCKPVTNAVPIYGFTRQRFHPRKNPSRGIIAARRYKQKTFTQEHSHSK